MDGKTDLDSISDNPEALMKAFAAMEGNPEPEPKPEPKPEPEPENAQGVETKDGKHVIPYSVLRAARERAARAEASERELREKLSAYEQQQIAVNNGANTGENAHADGTPDSAEQLSAEDMEALKEDFPTVYKAINAMREQGKAMAEQFAPVRDTVARSESIRAHNERQMVQDAIDAVPKLAHIQATNAEAFELAQQYDAILRRQPQWADKPLSERFACVVSRVESDLGEIVLPDGKANVPLKQENVKATAMKRAQQASAQVPSSLSDFSAGQSATAAQSVSDEIESMTAAQLAEKFQGMSSDQMDAFLAKIV
ncbi:MAG: hypothetical protein IJS87_02435 [Rhodocyclaceae bacterium]|nr:hypothetical protein [Rhodocyclaceae bacterium]